MTVRHDNLLSGEETMGNVENEDSLTKQFLAELESTAQDEVHKRLIKAYREPDPVRAMEAEFSTILLEVLHDKA